MNRENSCYQFSIASSFSQDWCFVENLFKSLSIKYSIRRRKQLQRGKINGSSIIRISNRKDIRLLINYIYPNGYEFGLKRKFDKGISMFHDDLSIL